MIEFNYSLVKGLLGILVNLIQLLASNLKENKETK